MKYKPLDLSFMNARINGINNQQAQIANTAQMILQHANWNTPSQVSMKEIAKANKAAKANHKQTFLGGVFDLLQTPLYGIANALDEALAGHQSDPNDSVLEDIGKSVGGVFTGGAKGIGSGLRGATSILDVLPGVDINDDWQSDPTDKTHMSDVAIRQLSGMSTKDAADPKNWDKVKARLEKANDKSLFSKTFPELFLPDNLDQPDSQRKFLRNEMIGGIASDVGVDPLNFLSLPTKAATASKAITEGLDAARAGTETVDAIKSGLGVKNASGFAGKSTFSAGHAPPVAAIDEVAPGTSVSVPSIAPTGKGFEGFKNLSGIGRREIGKAPVAVSVRDQKLVAKSILELASKGEKGWVYKAADVLRRHPNVEWAQTEDFLLKASKAVKGKHNPSKMGPVLLQRIKADVDAVKPAEKTIERRVVNLPGDVVIKPGATRLKRPEAQLANKVVRTFEAEILGRRSAPGTGEGLVRAIASGKNVRYSAPQQARMWNHITSNLKYSNPAKFEKAVRILRGVENYFISKGAIPHSAWKTAESVPLRLSQVAEAIGPEILGKSHSFITQILKGNPKALAELTPQQIDAIEALKASEAAVVAPAVNKGIEAGKGAIEDILKMPLSTGRRKELLNQATRIGQHFTAQLGGGDVGAKVAGEYLGNLLGKSDPINAALRANKLKTEAWLAKSATGIGKGAKNDPDFLKSVTNAISKAAELPPPAKLGLLSGPKALVADWLGARFNAAYGVQDMRQIFLREQSSAMSTASRRAKLINELGRRFPVANKDLWHEAFTTAQRNGIASGQVAELQAEIAKVMENLFGGTGLRSGAISDSTVVGRNRLLVAELNKNLKRFGLSKYQFEYGKKVKDALGETHDLSQGMDWLKSWELWKVDQPYEFLHKIQGAIEHTVREKNMFDDIVSRFASPNKKGGVKFGVNHPRLAGYYFTEEGARQAKQFVNILDQISTPNSKALQYFDHVLSKIKAGLTVYGGMIGHQMTNLNGDIMYNWIAGVNNPNRYTQAIKTMQAQKGRYGDIANFDKLTGPDALKQAVARSLVKPDAGLAIPAAGNKTIVTMKNGTRVTADMIYTAAMKQGILPSARVLEDVTTDVTSFLDKIKPLGGRGQRTVHAVSEVRDHIPRLAQFIDGIAKSKGTFGSAVEASARSVRKWHPDGLDLTHFERQFMKRVFPFYSWTRKAIPLAIESAIFAAPKVMAYPRLMEAIALSNGIEPADGLRDPFPTDQMFPDWVRERGIGPIMGGAGNYSVVNPSTPVIDTLALIGKPGQSSMDMMNPMVKVPIEVAQDQTLGQKVPITNYGDYAVKQIPVLSTAGRISGQYGVSDSTRAEGFPNWLNLLNAMTGAKAVNTGKYQKSAQFDLKDYLKSKRGQQGR